MDDNEFDEKEIKAERADECEKPGDYEIGYAKPPEHTRFKKGVSGNPSGRPKRTAGFDEELIREFNSPLTINENGKRRQIPKVRGIVKQMTNKALAGDIRAARVVLPLYQQAQNRAAQSAVEDAKELERLNNPKELTREELEFLILGGDPKEIVRRRKVERKKAK